MKIIPMDRKNLIIAIVGRRSSGKSSHLHELNMNHKKCLVFDHDYNEVWSDYRSAKIDDISRWRDGKIFVVDYDSELAFQEVRLHANNCRIIYEDASKYLKGDLNDYVKSSIYASKQRNVDIFFSFHAINLIPPKLMSLLDVMIIHKTKDNFDASIMKQKIPPSDFEDIKTVHKWVMNHPSPYFSLSIKLN